jgi:hypothetical protein
MSQIISSKFVRKAFSRDERGLANHRKKRSMEKRNSTKVIMKIDYYKKFVAQSISASVIA